MPDLGEHSAFFDSMSRRWRNFRFSDSRCLIGVSGGADSVALLLAMLRVHPFPERVEVGHFNHRWRGEESDSDAQFVAELCTRLEVPFHAGVAGNEESRSRSEASARDVRYEFLAKTAYAVGARTVVTAHTSDDRVETLVHHLLRGTGMAGAASIPHLRPLGEELLLVRPMIEVSRAQVESYLSFVGQEFRLDSSNQDTSYRRNYIRQKLLPEIRAVYGERVDERLWQFTEHAADYLALSSRLAAEYGETVVQRSTAAGMSSSSKRQIHFLTRNEQTADWLVVREYLAGQWKENGWSLAPMTTTHWNGIREFFESNAEGDKESFSGDRSSLIRMNLPGDLQLVQKGPWLEISEK